ncbi:DUF4294 domain-containing protein [Rubrolithibacter danxiaensis]|uniref:DUF4294 domain-containing protein n=1 Tax=Rubrolithibacter danxiaensis TaxID=3390805 RepID=UPI003BF92917
MKILRFAAVLCLFFVNLTFCAAQEKYDPYVKGKNDTIRVALTKVEEELIPWMPLPEIVVFDSRIYRSAADRAKFYRLRYNVLKVMPYALFARDRYNKLQQDLAITKNRREQRKLVKACEKEIKDMFNREIKNMTITQGEILIKLIDRETGNSSYDMLKELKGGFSAFFYQSIARVFGHNLKEQYDAQQERDIETIIQSSAYRYNRYN